MGSIEDCLQTLETQVKYFSPKVGEQDGTWTLEVKEVYTPEDDSFSKRILKVGQGKIIPTIGSQCQVSLKLLEDNVKLPENELGKYKINGVSSVELGETDGVLSDLFDRILMTMKKGEFAYVKVNLKNHYGDLLFSGVTHPPNSPTIGFNIVLLGFNMPSSSEGCLENMANSQLAKANEFLQSAKPPRAISRYRRVLTCLGVSDDLDDENGNEPDEKSRPIVLECFQKLVRCYTEMYKYDAVIDACTQILKLEPNSHEFILKRGQTYANSKKFNLAIADFDCLLKLDPENKQAKMEKEKIEALIQNQQAEETKDRKDHVASKKLKRMNAIKKYLKAADERHTCWRMQLLRKYANNSTNDNVIPEVIREYEEQYFDVVLGNFNKESAEKKCGVSCEVEGCDDLLFSALEMALDEYDAMCPSEAEYSSNESSASTSGKDVKDPIKNLEITGSTL